MIIGNASLKEGIFDIRIEDGIIAEIGHFEECDIDACGKKVIPGLIDTHIHGFGGYDVSDGKLNEISRSLAQNGTTSFIPTTMTGSAENIERVTSGNIKTDGATVLGFHLEGPYISKEKKGAQNEKYIKEPDITEFRRFKNVINVTVAPELFKMTEFIKNSGCHVSIGHTSCSYADAVSAINAGADCLTHTFNAMPPFLHREPGPIGAAFENGIYAEVICDGRHIDRVAVLALYKLFGPDRLIFISDCICPAGLPNGTYSSGGKEVIMNDGKLTLSDGTLAGGSQPLLSCVKTAVGFGIDFYEAVAMASSVPAKRFGLNKGKLISGFDADLVILNNDMSVYKVMINGKWFM